MKQAQKESYYKLLDYGKFNVALLSESLVIFSCWSLIAFKPVFAVVADSMKN